MISWPASRAQGLRTGLSVDNGGGHWVPGMDGFVWGRRWMSSGEEAPDTRRGLALSFGAKLPREGGSVAISI